MLIAYYDGQFRRKAPDTIKTHDVQQKENRLTPWDEKSLDHVEKSRYLAKLLKKKILEYDQGIKVDIIGIPIVVLEGADLPALLIEIGYLTNPSDLQKLKSNRPIKRLCRNHQHGLGHLLFRPMRLVT